MCGLRNLVLGIFCGSMLAIPAVAEPAGVHWHDDLDSAIALAQQTGRHVLIHFWTPSCAPCRALDHQVFSQPAVASALEARFVPVKLNANEVQDVAQRFGVSRVPTDVVINSQGQLLGKLVSPSTPTAYISEITQVANRSFVNPGGAFPSSIVDAASTRNLNAAYADLVFGPPPQAPNAIPGDPSKVPWPAEQAHGVSSVFGDQDGQSHEISAPTTAAQVSRFPLSSTDTITPEQPYAPTSQIVNPTAPVAASQDRLQSKPAIVTNHYAVASSSPPQPKLPSASDVVATLPNAAPDTDTSAAVPQPSASETTAASASSASKLQLPAGSPPLAFDGYCPVTMKNDWSWKPGNTKWGLYHRGRTYLFADESARNEFWANPDRYSPVLSGADPVLMIDQNQTVDGHREHSLEYDGLFYLFSSEETLQRFATNPERYATQVRQSMGLKSANKVR